MGPDGKWSLCRGGSEDWIAIGGPTTVADALRQAGQWSLGAPPRDFDDEAWSFRAVFDGPAGAAVLGFDGIATCARVLLNGEPILASTNMFVAHRCDVRKILRPRGNELLLQCDPLNAELKARKPRPRWRAPMVTQQQLRWWRTTLLGRTPGWSPSAAPVGPWRDVWLASDEEAALRDVRVEARLDGRDGIVRCAGNIRISRGGKQWQGSGGELRIPDVDLWWPHTHGEPALYDVTLIASDGREIALAPIGFRHVEVDTSGGGFRVRVNGQQVFCRGAVWMPLDVVSLRAPREQYDTALAQVRAAGMNMVRVAGMAVYEEDAFYEACDRAGVLVWHDFMFANMDYPGADASFASSVETEVRQQLMRWGSHPCIAVLCGNSEAEQQAAMWGATRDAWAQPLFHETLPKLCSELTPGLPYWPSSAHGGALPQQPDTGTTSFYGVGAYLRPLEDARRSQLKFATECLAFANAPAEGSAGDRVPRDLNASWDFRDVRDHYLEQLFRVNARELRSTDPERYLALSRMTSGEVMASAFSEWRRHGSDCGGALVLMLRDLERGAGWGLLDHQGRPKACWHALKRTLQAIQVVITDEGLNGLYVHAINETAGAAKLRLSLRAWHNGNALVAKAEREIELHPRETRAIHAAELLDHFLDLNWSHRFGPPPCDVVVCSLIDEQGRTISSAHHFPHRTTLAARCDIGLHARVLERDNFTCEVAVSTQCFAHGVHFEVPGMTADEEHFNLEPGIEARVILRGKPAAAGRVMALNASSDAAIEGMGS
jgi:beta-mannosidase